jgi:hypothetical protein
MYFMIHAQYIKNVGSFMGVKVDLIKNGPGI